MSQSVHVRREPVLFPTFEPDAPDKNPMFLERRVYQGSSGRVYPLPFYNRISEDPVDRAWDAIYLSNEFIEVMLLPEIGGRVHAIRDLSNGYEAIYRQSVIKPALVGLGGPWASGGIEFNWPQHHRPSTFMPKDVAIQYGDFGEITVWMGEHEPMDRTKGMIGICLHPGRSVIEIKARLYNRTPYVQTFLYWANIGTHVHEAYQSFFPPDAHMVADHAKRALSSYPLANGLYYGVDYGARGEHGTPDDECPGNFVPANCGGRGPTYPPNDISWYANIPVPTSYMCLGTEQDFVGGYDHARGAGLLHVADHHIAPGKKQWTWGNHEFGYAWDRNLTESDGPYIELMAGIYTDNQPDFSYIMPGETREFSHFLYPYQAIGRVHFANVDAAITIDSDRIGVAATREIDASITATRADASVESWKVRLAPDQPFVQATAGAVKVEVRDGADAVIASYQATPTEPREFEPATEPPMPADVPSTDELFIIGQHLEQYRHASRSSADYWREAIRRDAGDARCNNALGLWHFKRGEFEVAKQFFDQAIQRVTSRNPNPYDGEPYYNLGLALRFLGRDKEAADAFAKSAWNAAWQAPAYHALGELACRRKEWPRAIVYLDKAIRKDQDNLKARNLRAMIPTSAAEQTPSGPLSNPPRKASGSKRVLTPEARVSLAEILLIDPLDVWSKWLRDDPIETDNQTILDLTIDLMRAGFYHESLEVLGLANPDSGDGTAPMLAYYQAHIFGKLGLDQAEAFSKARTTNSDYCFPARLEDIEVLAAAPKDDRQAAYLLGNLMYDRRRYDEAVALWERAEPTNSIAQRNLGIAAFNFLHDPDKAKHHYDRAVEAAPNDGRLWYERDQLWKRIGVEPQTRLAELEQRTDIVASRDDLTIEFCTLLVSLGRANEAAEILENKVFQPWEGGEGMALGVFTRTQLALARSGPALPHIEFALCPPSNLGEARHLLANASDVWLSYGDALNQVGRTEEAMRWWNKAANFKGDFQGMAVQSFSEMTSYQIMALRQLGRMEEAERRLLDLEAYARTQLQTKAKVDYFATSLPTMLVFDDDLQLRQNIRAILILAQIAELRDDRDSAVRLVGEVLRSDPNHPMAIDLRARIT
jgi:tetratricopeptide (TPR) repeat protein